MRENQVVCFTIVCSLILWVSFFVTILFTFWDVGRWSVVWYALEAQTDGCVLRRKAVITSGIGNSPLLGIIVMGVYLLLATININNHGFLHSLFRRINHSTCIIPDPWWWRHPFFLFLCEMRAQAWGNKTFPYTSSGNDRDGRWGGGGGGGAAPCDPAVAHLRFAVVALFRLISKGRGKKSHRASYYDGTLLLIVANAVPFFILFYFFHLYFCFCLRCFPPVVFFSRVVL